MHTFYEAVATMLSDKGQVGLDHTKLLAKLMVSAERPARKGVPRNVSWHSIMHELCVAPKAGVGGVCDGKQSGKIMVALLVLMSQLLFFREASGVSCDVAGISMPPNGLWL